MRKLIAFVVRRIADMIPAHATSLVAVLGITLALFVWSPLRCTFVALDGIIGSVVAAGTDGNWQVAEEDEETYRPVHLGSTNLRAPGG